MEQHSPTDGYPNQYFIGGDNNEKQCLEEMEMKEILIYLKGNIYVEGELP